MDLTRISSRALLKRWISLNLRALRKEAGKSRSEVMERLGMSRAAVGHLETAERLPSKPALEILLDFYGVPERRDDFWRIVEAARKGRNWWDQLSGAVPPWFNLFLGLEAGAAELASFDAVLITGLLQTRGYADAVIRADSDLSDADVAQRVELRMGRQQILERADEPVRLRSIMDESVLWRRIGDTAVMRDQLAHLRDMADRPGIDLQVLPLGAGAHTAQQGGTFTVMTFPTDMVGDPGIVYHELVTTGFYLEEPDDIRTYQRTLTQLQTMAATPEDSQGMIERAMKEL